MAKIDAMLRMMSDKGVERTVLRSDVRYQVFTEGRKAEGPVMSGQQLRGLLEEIVPPALSANFHAGKAIQFRHASPFGQFNVAVMDDLGVLQATITPAQVTPASTTPSAPMSAPLQTPPPPPPSPLPGVIVPATPPASGWGQSSSAPPPPTSYPPPNYPPPVQNAPHYPPPNYGPPGYPPAGHPGPYGGAYLSHRSKIAAGLMALLLPGLGIHRFYIGHIGIGIVHLLLTFVFSWITCGLTLGVAWLWSIIDGIVILCGGMRDFEGRELS